ncbi:N-acetylglucosaminyl transferase component, partial [Spraguea lophii 42_110]
FHEQQFKIKYFVDMLKYKNVQIPMQVIENGIIEFYSAIITKSGIILAFLMNNPFGIKQDTLVNRTLGQIFMAIHIVHKDLINLSLQLDFISIRLSFYIIRTFYRLIVVLLVDLIDIFRNRNYNILKNRYDSVEYDLDTVILASIVFSVACFVYYNIFLYYFYFLGIIFIL